ncbi:MAG: sodium:solute symporter family protein [Leptospiraceae bacterium]|nr:sodium:solute symporter family protein [Leptospiraceae bacterium]MCP5497214.1 sodium:solute symporter family protein [Leptospiraceae bacterium]
MNYQEAVLSEETGWILMVLLGIFWIGLGAYWGRKSKTLDDYMLAGRNVGLALGTATVMATWITSNTTMLAPQFAIQMGIWGLIAYSTASIGLLLFAPMARRIRHLMPKGFTSGDFVYMRYGRSTWILFLLISIFYSITWLVSMGMAGGILLNSLTGISYQYGVTAILLVCVLYTLLGGLYAVIGTDYFQSVIILIGIVVIGVTVLFQLDINKIYTDISQEQPSLLYLFFPPALMALFNNLLFGVGEITHSNVWWSRAFAMGKGIGQRAYSLAGILWVPIPIAAGFIALSSGSLGINVISPDMIGPTVASKVLGYYGAISVFVVIFCSLASSIDSLLAATSDLITEDIYRKLLNPKADERSLKKVSASVIVLLGLFTWTVCLPKIGTLATVLFFAGPMVGSTIWPIITGIYWKRAGFMGAFWGMFLGTGSGLVAYFVLGWYTATLIGTGVSMIVVCVFTYLFPDNFEWKNLSK